MNIQQELIEIVASAAKQLGIDIMLIGAFARDYWSGKFSLQVCFIFFRKCPFESVLVRFCP